MRWSERNPLKTLAGIATSQGTTLKTQPCTEGVGSTSEVAGAAAAPRERTSGQAHPHQALPITALLTHRLGLPLSASLTLSHPTLAEPGPSTGSLVAPQTTPR